MKTVSLLPVLALVVHVSGGGTGRCPREFRSPMIQGCVSVWTPSLRSGTTGSAPGRWGTDISLGRLGPAGGGPVETNSISAGRIQQELNRSPISIKLRPLQTSIAQANQGA